MDHFFTLRGLQECVARRGKVSGQAKAVGISSAVLWPLSFFSPSLSGMLSVSLAPAGRRLAFFPVEQRQEFIHEEANIHG